MKNKNNLSKIRKFVYFFGCLVLASYFIASPRQTEASFLGDIWNGIIKISDFSDKATSPDGNSKTSISNNTAAVIASVTSSDTTRVKQLSDEIFSANADPLKKQLLLNLAKERETLVKELMRKDPALFLSLAIKASQRNLLPLDIQPYIEREATLTSKIEVIHYDDFKNPQNSRFDYFLKDTDGKTKINFYPTDPLYLVSGTMVKAGGFKLGNNFVSQTNRTNFAVQETPALASTGDQKTLVILLDFNNSPSTHPFTKEKAYDLVFNDQFQKFYKEQSYNQVSFSGEVVDWYKLNRDVSSIWCPAPTFDELGQIIKDRGINLANYKRLVFLPNTHDSGGWSIVGVGSASINGSSYNFSYACVGIDSFDKDSNWGEQPFEWKNFDFVMTHEIGHSLGVWHANGWDCGNKAIGDNCTHMEYGNYFDTMGNNSRALHFNAFYKEILGWIKSSQVLKINQSGTYSINTLEKDSAIKFAKVSNYAQTDTPYYLEYRKAFGFDSKLKEADISSNQKGVFINNATEIRSEVYATKIISRLIDASPTADSWWDDTINATLNSNATFSDPDNGITIDRVSNPTENSIDFRVTYNKPSDVDLTLDKTSDGTVKLYAWRDIFNDYGETVDNDFTDGETKTLRNDWHYKLSAIPNSSSLGFSGWIGCDSQTQGNSWTDADGVVHYSTPSFGENACFVELSDESKQIEVDFTEPSEISASPNPVSSGKSATLTWAASSGPGDCYLYSPTDNLKTIKSTAYYLGTNSTSRFYKGPGYYATVARNASGVTASLTAPTYYTLTCDIGTLNNAVSYTLKVGIVSSGTSGSSSSFSYGVSGVDVVFNYIGGAQQYLVPSGVTNVNIKASGAQGNGLGGESSAIVAVTPGETLYIYAGGQPSGRTGGWNGGGNGGTTSWGGSGGGGGGASDVRQKGTVLANRIIVAAGGGGRGSNDAGGSRMGGNGGIAGGVAGNTGGSGANDAPVSGGGGGGTQTSAGAAGTAGGGNGGAYGNPGAVGNGGTGGVGPSGASGGGGGGGGYFGGGGGGVNYQSAGGGGGGSSYVTGARTSVKSGIRSGNGQVIITPFLSSSSSSSLSFANHTATTGLTTNIASASAALNGAVNPKGESVYYQFFYRKESESSKSDQKTSYIFAGSGSSDISVSAKITNLSPGTKYVYQLYAYSYTTKTMVKGDLKSFTTPGSSSSSSSSTASSSTASTSSSSSQSSASVGLVASYNFDEGSGLIAFDNSGNGNKGTINGARWAVGKIGNGLSFDGIDDYIDLGNLTSLQPSKISLSAWFKTDSSGGIIVRKRLYGYGLEMLPSGKVSFWIYNSAAVKFSAISPNIYNDGQWHNAMGIYDGYTVKLYIDGFQITTASAGPVHYGAGTIAIGRDGNSNESYFKGALDEVKIYNKALNSQEALAIYNKEGGSSSSVASSRSSSSSSSFSISSVAVSLSNGLVAQYRFDDGSANDSYGNNNGSVFGAVSSGGIAGGALSFNGNSYVQITGLLNNPANITISAWTNLTSSDTNGAEIISLGDHVGLRLHDPAKSFGVSAFYRYANGWRTVIYGANYAGTGWHHFAYVINDTANSQKLYVDGALASSTSYADSIQWTGQGTDTFIGKHSSNANYDLNGSIDEVKIYNRALTAEEVSKLYSLPGINCDASGACAMGYKINWLNQMATALESIGQTIKELFTIKK